MSGALQSAFSFENAARRAQRRGSLGLAPLGRPRANARRPFPVSPQSVSAP
jgi:hypothetical protein